MEQPGMAVVRAICDAVTAHLAESVVTPERRVLITPQARFCSAVVKVVLKSETIPFFKSGKKGKTEHDVYGTNCGVPRCRPSILSDSSCLRQANREEQEKTGNIRSIFYFFHLICHEVAKLPPYTEYQSISGGR